MEEKLKFNCPVGGKENTGIVGVVASCVEVVLLAGDLFPDGVKDAGGAAEPKLKVIGPLGLKTFVVEGEAWTGVCRVETGLGGDGILNSKPLLFVVEAGVFSGVGKIDTLDTGWAGTEAGFSFSTTAAGSLGVSTAAGASTDEVTANLGAPRVT